MATDNHIEYRIPRVLWENMEAVLLAQSRRYIGELAKCLNIPEKELVKQVLPTNDSLKVIIQDSHCDSNQCSAYIQNSKLTLFCRKPVVYGSEFCNVHRYNRMSIVIGDTAPIKLTRVKDINTTGPMWKDEYNTLYDSCANRIGNINANTCIIKIFIVDS